MLHLEQGSQTQIDSVWDPWLQLSDYWSSLELFFQSAAKFIIQSCGWFSSSLMTTSWQISSVGDSDLKPVSKATFAKNERTDFSTRRRGDLPTNVKHFPDSRWTNCPGFSVSDPDPDTSIGRKSHFWLSEKSQPINESVTFLNFRDVRGCKHRVALRSSFEWV